MAKYHHDLGVHYEEVHAPMKIRNSEEWMLQRPVLCEVIRSRIRLVSMLKKSKAKILYTFSTTRFPIIDVPLGSDLDCTTVEAPHVNERRYIREINGTLVKDL